MAHSWDSPRKAASLTTFSPAEPMVEGPQTSLPVSSLLAKLLPFSLPVTALRGQWAVFLWWARVASPGLHRPWQETTWVPTHLSLSSSPLTSEVVVSASCLWFLTNHLLFNFLWLVCLSGVLMAELMGYSSIVILDLLSSATGQLSPGLFLSSHCPFQDWCCALPRPLPASLLCFLLPKGEVSQSVSSVTQLCPTLWDPTSHSMPGLPGVT